MFNFNRVTAFYRRKLAVTERVGCTNKVAGQGHGIQRRPAQRARWRRRRGCDSNVAVTRQAIGAQQMTAGRLHAYLRRPETDWADLAVVRHRGSVVAVGQTEADVPPCVYDKRRQGLVRGGGFDVN